MPKGPAARVGDTVSHAAPPTLTAGGVGLMSANHPGADTTTPTGRLMVQLLASFTDFEREQGAP